jgi:TolA-binding protein
LLFCGFWVTAAPARAHHGSEPASFPATLRDAERAYDRASYAEALAGLRTALDLATRRDNQAYILFRIGLALRRLGRTGEARSVLRNLAAERAGAMQAPRALYVAARIRERELGDPAGAEIELEETIRRFPKSDAAQRALRRLADLRARRDPADAVERLRRFYRRYRHGPLGPQAAYLAARLCEERLASAPDAIRLYELLARRYPKSGLYDDALWRAAALHRRHGRPGRAIRLYRRIVETRRESWALGSYNSIYLDRAALEIPRIELEDLRDPRRAARGFRELALGYPHSLLRAEARKLLIRALLAQGRSAEARRELAELVRLHPDSRHTREAKKLLP